MTDKPWRDPWTEAYPYEPTEEALEAHRRWYRLRTDEDDRQRLRDTLSDGSYSQDAADVRAPG